MISNNAYKSSYQLWGKQSHQPSIHDAFAAGGVFSGQFYFSLYLYVWNLVN